MKARGCQKLVQTKHTSIHTHIHSHRHAHTHINTKGDRDKHQHLCLADAGGRKEATFWARNRAIGPAGTVDPCLDWGADAVTAFQCQPLSGRSALLPSIPKDLFVFMTESNEGGVRR